MESITNRLARYISTFLGNHMTRRQLIQIERSYGKSKNKLKKKKLKLKKNNKQNERGKK